MPVADQYYLFTPALPPVLLALRSQQHRRRNAMMYISIEPDDPTVRSLMAAETSLQLLLDYSLLSPAVEESLPTPFHESVAMMIETLSFFATATTPAGQIAPFIQSRTRAVQLPGPVARNALQALMVVVLTALSNNASIVFVSLRKDHEVIKLRIETDAAPPSEENRVVVEQLLQHQGQVAWHDHSITIREDAHDTFVHWETVLSLSN